MTVSPFFIIFLRIIAIGFLLLHLSFGVAAEGVRDSKDESGISVSLTEVALLPWARTIKDPDGRLSADEVLALPVSPEEYMGNTVASFFFSTDVYWFLIPLKNSGATPLQRLLVLEPTWLDDVQVTLVQPDGAKQLFKGGDSMAFKHRAIPHRKINFELSLPPGESRLLVRVQTRDPYIVGMTLWERSAFFAADVVEAKYYGVLYGVLGAMLLYNLILFASVREPIYAVFIIYITSFLIAQATYNGHTYPLLWPDSPIWGNWAHSIFIYLFILGWLLFATYFLELRSKLPHVYRLAKGMVFILLASFVITAIFGGYHFHVSSAILWVFIYSPFVLWMGISSLLSGNYAARYLLVATTAGLIGAAITALSVTAIIPFSFYTFHALDFGMMLDTVLLSLALADRLKISRAEIDEVRGELLEATRGHAKQLEETVAQRTLELKKVNETKDKFFSIVAHDLRGPIGSLSVLFNELILSPKDFNEESLRVVRTTTKNTNDFLEQLLTWARSQKGDIAFNPEPIEIGKILAKTQSLFFTQAQTKGIHLNLNIDTPCWVFADLPMTQTILRNLTSNALKFTDRGGSVSIAVDTKNDQCLLQMIDTGVGMSDQVQSTLLQLDVKPQSTPGTQSESGTGLGLILCAEFVARNGGAIGLQSQKGEGTTFWFTLPKHNDTEISSSTAVPTINVVQ